jgi:protein-S-isoprenylcysteine O-methyltransferase Ste14
MNEATLLLYLMNFALIGALPFIFFKQGRFNLMWCVTSAPYVLCAAFLIESYVMGYHTRWDSILNVIAVPFSVGSIALIFFTMGTHRVSLALWHQQNDAPHHIVTYGPYRRIRHPFYAAFLLALFGAFVFLPEAGTVFTFLYAGLILNFTAKKEEMRLKSSQFGSEYERYMQSTGRFCPKMQSGVVDRI